MNDYYQVQVNKQARKFFRKVNPKQARQLREKLQSLVNDPLPQDSTKLHIGGYRVTVGEYRILYDVDHQTKMVTVFEIAKRDEHTYRK